MYEYAPASLEPIRHQLHAVRDPTVAGSVWDADAGSSNRARKHINTQTLTSSSPNDVHDHS